MVTAAGTRNVISAEDLFERVREEDGHAAPARGGARAPESESRLVRRERRRDLDLYEITSEFLVPWISAPPRRAPRAQARRRDRRRLARPRVDRRRPRPAGSRGRLVGDLATR